MTRKVDWRESLTFRKAFVLSENQATFEAAFLKMDTRTQFPEIVPTATQAGALKPKESTWTALQV